jgi:hypothetical protein
VIAAIEPGATFAGYRVESVVGRGGMGVVYRAWDLSLERPVALKLIAPELAEDERFRARFLREPRLAASLDHPGVVPIYEAGEWERQLYLAMRFVEGSDLKSVLEREGRLPPERALIVLAQVADALDAAHRRDLVHRDVKPANVLLDGDGHAYLTDFGITKQLGAVSTDTGRMLGTLDYLAPEQIRGEDVDGRTDGYALGCVLYECLAGTPPFRRSTEAETLWAHMNDEPPALPSEPRLAPVLRRGLAKDREDRYGTCAELVDEAAGQLGLAAPRAGGRLSRAALLLAIGGVLLGAAAVFALTRSLGDDGAESGGPLLDVATNSVGAVDARAGELALAAPLPGRPTDVAAAGRQHGSRPSTPPRPLASVLGPARSRAPSRCPGGRTPSRSAKARSGSRTAGAGSYRAFRPVTSGCLNGSPFQRPAKRRSRPVACRLHGRRLPSRAAPYGSRTDRSALFGSKPTRARRPPRRLAGGSMR